MESESQAQVGPQTLGEFRHPPTVRRLFAALIDFLAAIILSYLLIGGLMDELNTEADTNPLIGAWILSMIFLVGWPYYTVSEIIWGRTIGKALLGIKVVSLFGNRNRWRMLLRNLVRITWAIPYLGYLFLITDAVLVAFAEEHRRLGDIAAGTTVIRTKVKVADK